MNLRTLEKNLDRIKRVDLGKLRTEAVHFVKVCNDSPSTRDGYPTQHIGADAPTGRAPSKNPDEADLNSVEGAADPARRPVSDPIDMKTHLAVQQIAQAADALELAVAKFIECRNLQAQVIHDPKPECHVMRQRADVFEEARTKTDLDGLLPEPRWTCRWVADFARANGVLPTREQCRAHARGDRVMINA